MAAALHWNVLLKQIGSLVRLSKVRRSRTILRTMCAHYSAALSGRLKTMIGRLTQFTVALLATASLIIAPVYAQAQEGQSGQQGATQEPASQQQNTPARQNPAGVQPPSQPEPQTGAPGGDSVRDLRLGAGPDYSGGKRFLKNIINPYTPLHM